MAYGDRVSSSDRDLSSRLPSDWSHGGNFCIANGLGFVMEGGTNHASGARVVAVNFGSGLSPSRVALLGFRTRASSASNTNAGNRNPLGLGASADSVGRVNVYVGDSVARILSSHNIHRPNVFFEYNVMNLPTDTPGATFSRADNFPFVSIPFYTSLPRFHGFAIAGNVHYILRANSSDTTYLCHAFDSTSNAIDSGTYNSAKDLALPSGFDGGGIASDGTTVWLNDSTTAIIYAYNASTTARDRTRDIDHGISGSGQIAYNNGRLYLSTGSNNNVILRAFDVSTDPMPIRKSTDLVKRFCGHRPIIKFYDGARIVWEQGSAPSITSFTAAPTDIDLDTRATGNVTLTFAVTDSTHNRIYNTRTNANVPLTTSTTAILAQPQQTTTYRLVCQNATGSTHQDVTITVTKNPTIASLRRTGFQQIPGGGGSVNYRFGMTITGLPRPAVSYRFGDGQSGNIVHNLFQQGANPYTWTIEFTITRANSNNTSLVITATNSSGTVTSTLSDINAST